MKKHYLNSNFKKFKNNFILIKLNERIYCIYIRIMNLDYILDHMQYKYLYGLPCSNFNDFRPQLQNQ